MIIHSNYFSNAKLPLPGFASGRKQDRVPWKQIKENTDYFVEPRYLPEPDDVPQLEDPSDMKKEQITRLLDHWRRPVHATELFRFSHVLVNSKTEETTKALYADSFAALYTLAPDNWNADYNALSGVDSGIQLPTPITDPKIHCTRAINPASDVFLGNLTANPTHPSQNDFDPNIDPALQNHPSQNNFDPNIDPALQNPARSAPTPVIGLTSPTLTEFPTVPTDSFPSGAPTPVIGPSVNKSLSPKPRPQPQRRKTKMKPIAPPHEPYPTSGHEEELGRPKRTQKRKADIYLEAEEKTELAKKNQKKKRK